MGLPIRGTTRSALQKDPLRYTFGWFLSPDWALLHEGQRLPTVVPRLHLIGVELSSFRSRGVSTDRFLECEVEGVEAGVSRMFSGPSEQVLVLAHVEDAVHHHVLTGVKAMDGRGVE